jgi:hypothetical protein
MTREQQGIRGLFDKLMSAPLQAFPNLGPLNVSNDHGVYVICGRRGSILYVGRGDLRRRLSTHRAKFRLRGCRFRYLAVRLARAAALLEALATGCLCPFHIGRRDRGEIRPASPQSK